MQDFPFRGTCTKDLFSTVQMFYFLQCHDVAYVYWKRYNLRLINSDDNHREAEEERAGLSLFNYWQAFPKPDILCPDGTGKMWNIERLYRTPRYGVHVVSERTVWTYMQPCGYKNCPCTSILCNLPSFCLEHLSATSALRQYGHVN